MKKPLFIFFGLSVALLTFGQAEEQTICPMMIETEIDMEEFVEYEGKTVYLCCGTCASLWEENPDYYVKFGMEEGLLPQFGEGTKEKLKDVELLAQKFCPLRPECVVNPNSPSVEYEGKTIYFFRERDIERRWDRNPEEYFKEAREAGLLPQFDS